MKKLLIIAIAIAACSFSCTNKKTENTQTATTVDNLKTAIAGETNASAKYALFAEAALQQGQNGIAAMFLAAAAAENIHIQNHTLVLNDLGENFEITAADIQISDNLVENIQSAIDGETFEYTTMYPPMIEQSNKENIPDAVRTFTFAKKAEEVHAQLYTEALEWLKTGREDQIALIWYVCPTCGNLFNTLDGYEICAICGVNKNLFTSFEK